MSVITINGPIGCGAIEVGKLVSQKASLSYVDRMLFSEAAKVLGSPVPDLIRPVSYTHLTLPTICSV